MSSKTLFTMKEAADKKIGTVTSIALPSEFQFQVNPDAKKPLLQDFVVTEHPAEENIPLLAKIVRISRFNPLLPEESALELARMVIDESLAPLPLFGKMEMVAAACQVLGSLEEHGNLRSPGFPVKPGTSVYLPSSTYMKAILSGMDPKDDLVLGHLRNRPDISAIVNANEILNKHLAILAMTGSGKTYATSVILEELMKMGFPLLIIDPHADYVNLGKKVSGQRFDFEVPRGKPRNYNLTIFDASIDLTELERDEFIEFVQGVAEEEISAKQRSEYREAYNYAKKKQKPGLDGILQYIDDAEDSPTKGAMLRQVRRVRSIVSGVDMSLKFEKILSVIGPGMGVVLNMSSLPALVQRINVQIIVERLFERRKRFVIERSKGLKKLETFPPLFVVIEEAHNYAPAQVEEETFPSRTVLRRIATEGRKFGFGLCVISQRPSRLDATVLSQCNSQIILRIVNPNDQNYIRQTVESLAYTDLLALPDLSQGEALVSGAMTPIPSLIRIKTRESMEGIPAVDRIDEIANYAPATKAEKRAVVS